MWTRSENTATCRNLFVIGSNATRLRKNFVKSSDKLKKIWYNNFVFNFWSVFFMKLLAVDGNSIVNRAFYGVKPLTTKSGQFTNAIYGFMNILNNLIQRENPDGVAVAFDLKAPTFRHKMYDEYKAGRKPMPAELAEQIPVLKELLKLFGYSTIELEGYEADDILGTLAARCCASGSECVIATGDRDSFQLVGDCVTVRLAFTRGGQSGAEMIENGDGTQSFLPNVNIFLAAGVVAIVLCGVLAAEFMFLKRVKKDA